MFDHCWSVSSVLWTGPCPKLWGSTLWRSSQLDLLAVQAGRRPSPQPELLDYVPWVVYRMMSFCFKIPARLVFSTMVWRLFPVWMEPHHLNMLLFMKSCRAKFCYGLSVPHWCGIAAVLLPAYGDKTCVLVIVQEQRSLGAYSLAVWHPMKISQTSSPASLFLIPAARHSSVWSLQLKFSAFWIGTLVVDFLRTGGQLSKSTNWKEKIAAW